MSNPCGKRSGSDADTFSVGFANSYAATVQTVSYIQSRIAMTLANPSLRRGQVGVKVVNAATGATVYERNAENYFMPASNMKSFTVATALEKLSPDFRFKTSAYSIARPDDNGVLEGDLIVYGRGDPTFSEAFYQGEPYKRFDDLADAIIKAGVKSINGSIIPDESYFNTNAIPFGWEWDDLQWYYGAEVSALTSFDNTLELKVTPTTAGSPCLVELIPGNKLVKIVNRITTSTRNQARDLKVTKLLGQNVIEVSGTMPEGDKGYSGQVSVTKPAVLFAEILAQRLRLKGIPIRGGSMASTYEELKGTKFPVDTSVEIAQIESLPLTVIAAKTMKPSQNLYTELILRALGEAVGNAQDRETTSDKKGTDAVQSLLIRAGVEPKSVIQYDGSGLSRHNLITPDASVKLYQYMDRSSYGPVWRNSLTIGGVDGTLRNRFKGTPAENNIRGKTGTLDQVSA